MILFRVDANRNIGVGHVMRCLSIADAMSCEVMFILSDDGMAGLIASRGYASRILDTAYDNMSEEIEILSSIIEENRPAFLLIDSYFVTATYLVEVRAICAASGCQLVYIDDVLAFPYPVDMLINYNIYANRAAYEDLYKGEIPPRFILGTAYAPLREEFQGMQNRVMNQKANDVLITTGGADTEHLTLSIIKEICSNYRASGLIFHIIIGAMNPDMDEANYLAESTSNIILHSNIQKMSELMRACDVAISAAGSTLYELCATQTPTITYILADNQIPGAEGFLDNGVMVNAGDVRVLGCEALSKKLLDEAIRLIKNCEERCRIADQLNKIVDGYGAKRIADIMGKTKEGIGCLEGKTAEHENASDREVV